MKNRLTNGLNDEQRALVEQLFRERHSYFQRISLSIVKSRELAEDVVSTAYVRVMDNIEKVCDLPRPKLTAFCTAVVKNASFDAVRQSRQSTSIDCVDNISDEDVGDIADEYIHSMDVDKVKRLVGQLDSDERYFIDLRYVLGMEYKDIGKRLNISKDAAKKRGQRITKKLRELYKKR